MENGSTYFSDDFLNCLSKYYYDNGHTGRTAGEYTGFLRAICAYLEKDFLDITPEDATKFCNYMEVRVQNETLAATTYNGRLSCYKNISSYIASNYPEYGFSNPFVFIKPLPYTVRIKASNVPSLEEIDALLTACADYPMYYLIFSLAFRVSLSSSDIVSLRRSYIHQEGDKLSIIFPADAAHKTPRTILLPEDVTVILNNYINNMVLLDAEGHLFYNKYGNPLTLRNLDSIVKKMIRRSGISEKYTLQSFRTRAILEMTRVSAEDDIALEKVSEYANIGQLRLGHYMDARHLANDCPAEFVNLRIKTASIEGADAMD